MRAFDANRTIGRVPDAPLVIVNPTAGGGRAARLVPWLEERLAGGRSGRVEVTRAPGDAERQAARAGSEGFDRVVAVGGDGTVQEVVNGLLDGGRHVGIGIVPVGNGNDLARSLGLPRASAEAWSVAVGASERLIDVLQATGSADRSRWFASAGGLGFDAQVAAAMATRSGWQRGSIGYLVTTLVELQRFSNCRVLLTLDGVTSEQHVLFVAIANGAYYGGGMRIAPDARTDDGQLDVCIVGDITRMTALRQLPNLYRGTHVKHPQVAVARVTSVAIEGDPGTLVHLDGEPFGGLPLRVEMAPSRLLVAMPLR